MIAISVEEVLVDINENKEVLKGRIILLLGSHVSMRGKKMLQGASEEAASYKATTFMIYTGAPQNTRRRPIEELNIENGQKHMEENGISNIVVHAPYIINIANTKKQDTFDLGVRFLRSEIDRSIALGAKQIVLHPGAHVGAGVDKGIARIVEGLNEVLTKDDDIQIALETMAGKGTEIDRSFDELLNEFDKIVGVDRIKVVHINDSKNEQGSHKDRHENIGFGHIGFDVLHKIVHHSQFENLPKILETPYVGETKNTRKPPYKFEIAMLKEGTFQEDLKEQIMNQ